MSFTFKVWPYLYSVFDAPPVCPLAVVPHKYYAKIHVYDKRERFEAAMKRYGSGECYTDGIEGTVTDALVCDNDITLWIDGDVQELRRPLLCRALFCTEKLTREIVVHESVHIAQHAVKVGRTMACSHPHGDFKITPSPKHPLCDEWEYESLAYITGWTYTQVEWELEMRGLLQGG